MVSQKQKLLAAGASLAVGFGLALLFRRPVREVVVERPAPPTQAAAAVLPTTLAAMRAATMPPVAVAPSLDGLFSPLAPLPATTAGLSMPVDSPLAELPAAAAVTPPAPSPETASDPAGVSSAALNGRPVYSPLDGEPDGESDAEAASPYRIHVIQEGDSLEKLAERYLDDRGRSLELFDLNRDVLDNPHLLRLGAELRIPVPPAEGD